MSDRTRAALGDLEHLSETITFNSGRHSLYLWRVWQAKDSVIVGAGPLEPTSDATNGLFQLQARMLDHFFHLLAVERRLSQRARRRRRGGGRKAIQQMELERRRLGRELHTGAGQMLAAIRLQLELITAEMPDASLTVQQALERIGVLAGDTLEQVRSLSKRLHPPEWKRLALGEAIRQLWELSGVPLRFEAELRLDQLPREPELEVKVLMYRAMQEALSNLMRHAKATRVTAWLRVVGDQIILGIEDNGIGFDVARLLRGPADVAGGIGLRSIREQTEALGGKMTIESGPSGTKLLITAAISPAET